MVLSERLTLGVLRALNVVSGSVVKVTPLVTSVTSGTGSEAESVTLRPAALLCTTVTTSTLLITRGVTVPCTASDGITVSLSGRSNL